MFKKGHNSTVTEAKNPTARRAVKFMERSGWTVRGFAPGHRLDDGGIHLQLAVDEDSESGPNRSGTRSWAICVACTTFWVSGLSADPLVE